MLPLLVRILQYCYIAATSSHFTELEVSFKQLKYYKSNHFTTAQTKIKVIKKKTN